MNARVIVPIKPMTAVELERHSRLGGGGSAIRQLMMGRKTVETGCLAFTFLEVKFVRIPEVCRRLEFRRDTNKAFCRCRTP